MNPRLRYTLEWIITIAACIAAVVSVLYYGIDILV